MKNSVNLNSTEWCDVIFEGKNQSYGAFEMRQTSWKRHIIAFGIILVGVVFVSFLPMIISKITAANKDMYNGGYEGTHVLVDLTKPEDPALDIEKPEVPEPPKYVEMKKFVPPVIDIDENVDDNEQMASMTDLIDDKKVAIGVFNVENGSTDEDAIRKEFEQAVVGDGNGTGGSKADEPIIVAEFPPQFPGGEAELYRFISENLKYPVVDQGNGQSGTSDRSLCSIKNR